MHARTLTAMLAVALPVCVGWALMQGSMTIGSGEALHALFAGSDGASAMVVRELRLPRVLAAIAVGGLLATAGVLLQVLLRNPLADPYVLGISGGASSATLAAMLLGLAGWGLNAAAFLGALGTMFLVFGLSRRGGHWTRERLLLTGVVMAAGFGAAISVLLAIAPEGRLPGMVFFLLGDLSATPAPWIGLAVLLAGLALATAMARSLNVLMRGELVAATLGENPLRLRLALYALASLLTAIAVTLAGAIGFVGLVVPHLLRLLGTTDHRWLLAQSALLGATLLLLADTLARTVVAPTQLPVGALTALLGVPLFLFLLARQR
ncbi:MAG: ABC transporter permease [Acidithiobacillales bacterium SM1_46]|nr:MAG: ABC transporter permease [Acidithiobacillales bacterium SM1_46]